MNQILVDFNRPDLNVYFVLFVTSKGGNRHDLEAAHYILSGTKHILEYMPCLVFA